MPTSKLQRYVSSELGKYLGRFLIYENTRPHWLSGNELDFYIPEINVAIEVQGKQHYEYIPHFHRNYQTFLDQKHRDQMKRINCSERGIKVYDVCTETDADILILDLIEKFIRQSPVNEKHKRNSEIVYSSLKQNIDLGNEYEIRTFNQICIVANNPGQNLPKAIKMMANLLAKHKKEGESIKNEFMKVFYVEHRKEIEQKIAAIKAANHPVS